jgi:hypothetical protein
VRFDEADLARAYGTIADRYGLPQRQAGLVARELESHTGLIQQVGVDYEYCHLSLQEFLAADSLVRGGRTGWWSRPAVGAVAVAVASDANAVFRDLSSSPAPSERAPMSGPGAMRVLVGVGWSRRGRTPLV